MLPRVCLELAGQQFTCLAFVEGKESVASQRGMKFGRDYIVGPKRNIFGCRDAGSF